MMNNRTKTNENKTKNCDEPSQIGIEAMTVKMILEMTRRDVFVMWILFYVFVCICVWMYVWKEEKLLGSDFLLCVCILILNHLLYLNHIWTIISCVCFLQSYSIDYKITRF